MCITHILKLPRQLSRPEESAVPLLHDILPRIFRQVMKLQVIQESIRPFLEALKSKNGQLHAYKYDMLENFSSAWTFDTDDFAGMYDRSLQSTVTRRWWKRDNYRPKEAMLLFIGLREEYVRQAFKELFKESRSIETRIDSFVYYCDELLRMYKHEFPKSIENNHNHDGMIISLYLAARYPDRYSLYPGRRIFNKALSALHARQGDTDDLPRFFKVCNTLYKLLEKDPDFVAVTKEGLRPEGHLLFVHEFLFFLAGAWNENTPA